MVVFGFCCCDPGPVRPGGLGNGNAGKVQLAIILRHPAMARFAKGTEAINFVFLGSLVAPLQAESCNYPATPHSVHKSLLLNKLPPINETGSIHRSVDTAGAARYGILSGKARMSGRLFKTKDWEKLAKEANFRPAEMAAICRVSLRQLERHFGKELKSTPKEWIRQFRCRLALKLIMEGYSNKAAASELKFGNPSHLCHEFRKVYGSSPQTLAQSEPRDVAFRQ